MPKNKPKAAAAPWLGLAAAIFERPQRTASCGTPLSNIATRLVHCPDEAAVLERFAEVFAPSGFRREALHFGRRRDNGLRGAVHRFAVIGDAIHFFLCKEERNSRSLTSQGSTGALKH